MAEEAVGDEDDDTGRERCVRMGRIDVYGRNGNFLYSYRACVLSECSPGSGYYQCNGPGGGGGGAGNPGGGFIYLYAKLGIEIKTSSTINTKGKGSSTGNGAIGINDGLGGYDGYKYNYSGDCSDHPSGHAHQNDQSRPTSTVFGKTGGDGGNATVSGISAGSNGGTIGNCRGPHDGNRSTMNAAAGANGGTGSGGGIVLITNGPWGIVTKGILDSRGGDNSLINSGSMKNLYVLGRLDNSGTTYYTNFNSIAGSYLDNPNQVWVHPVIT